MNRNRKNVLAVLMILVMAIGIGGCGVPRHYSNVLKVKHQLKSRYPDDHFMITETDDGVLGIEILLGDNYYIKTYGTCRKYPDATVKAYYNPTKKIYGDNYLGIKYAKQMDAFAEKLIQDWFPNQRTYLYKFSEEIPPVQDLPADTTFEQYLEGHNDNLHVIVECKESEFDKEAIQNAIVAKCKGKNLGFSWIRIDFVDNFDVSDNLLNDSYIFICISFDDDNNIEDLYWQDEQ